MIQIPYKIKKNIFTLKSQQKLNMGQEEMQLEGKKPHEQWGASEECAVSVNWYQQYNKSFLYYLIVLSL
jgi:maltodextrin utilization protein YvdJ